MQNNACLLVIDVQVGLFEEGEIYQAEQLVENIGDLIAKARKSETPIVYVQHDGGKGDSLEMNSPGFEIHPGIAPMPQDTIVVKRTPDSFYQTNLKEVLEAKGIKSLIIAGMQTEFCVDTTTRRAFSLGYDITLVKDAHSTFDSKLLTAAQIIAHHNNVLGGGFARLQVSDEVA